MEAARTLGKLGRGADPVLAFLEGWPQVAEAVGEAGAAPLMALVAAVQKSPTGRPSCPAGEPGAGRPGACGRRKPMRPVTWPSPRT